MRLEILEAEYQGQVSVEWRSYLLQPQPKPKPRDRFIAYTTRWLAPGGPGEQAPECGFVPWTESDDEPPTHSLPAAVAGKVALGFGRTAFDRFHLATMRAYFVEHRTISDPDVLSDIAASCGIERDEFRMRLQRDGGELARRVIDEHNTAIEGDVHAVPSVVINGFPIPGAQDIETYRRMIDRVLARRAGS